MTIGAAFLGGMMIRPRRVVRERMAMASNAVAAARAGLDSTDVQAIFAALPLGIIVIGPGESISYINPEAQGIFGLPERDKEPMENLRSRRLLEAIKSVRNSGIPATIELSLSRASEFMLRAHISRLDSRGMPRAPWHGSVLVALADETMARLADERHRDFVANASHELKTPLAIVSGVIETLQGPARGDPAGTERFLGRLSVQVHRMTRLIEDLMSLNRIELNERTQPSEPLSLAPFVAEIVDAQRSVAEASDVELRYERPDADLVILGDREDLSQLIANLIDNAVKYGGIGKDVTLALDADPAAGMARVSVTDQGPGIQREHIARLTERFYRVDVGRSREKGGTGLGLAICKHIANRHQGRIEIESQLGEGATFTVLLPLVNAVEPVAEQVPARAAAATAR